MNIVITDDDKIVAVSLKTILEATGKISVTAVGSSGQEAIELYRVHKPDVMLMDIRMNGMTGLEAGEIILKEDRSAKILYLTTFSDDEYIVKALTIGAKGYILKQDFQGIAPALEAVMNGQSVFGDTVMGKLPQLMKNNKKGFDYEEHDINEKEKEIIELVAEGMSNKEIAQELYLSEGTVRNYLSLILEKLNLRDRTQLAVFYYNNIR
ncbi:MAG: response regulator transcription factor [Ruminococcus sp.]|nr:response regulator transcription factor [Ruminococcus sp.]